MNPFVRACITVLALVVWMLVETTFISQLPYPVSSGWWAVLLLSIISWSVSRPVFFLCGAVIAVGYEMTTLQPFGIASVALGAMISGILFFEQKIFTRLSWISYSSVIVVGMILFVLVYGIANTGARVIIGDGGFFDAGMFFIQQGVLMIYYFTAALAVLVCKKICVAVVHKYFFSM